jgi:ChrR Cupin-like domain
MTTPIQSSLRRRLLERVRASQAHESQFLTVRRDATAWPLLATGVRCKPLARTSLARSCLVTLEPGAALPVDRDFSQAELVVLNGQAAMADLADVADLANTRLACGDAACMPHDPQHTVRAGCGGARLYLRLSAPEAPATGLTHFSTVTGEDGWEDFCPGVRIRALWHGGERSSMLVRMQAGAKVNPHAHPLEEECMMLAGEAFVGDTLLRSTEYQLAPMGSRHGAVTTDVGALFYVHGSLDPAAYI